jgi:hypothetical protein
MPSSKMTLADRLGVSVGLLLCFCAQRARRTRLVLPDGYAGYIGYPPGTLRVNLFSYLVVLATWDICFLN